MRAAASAGRGGARAPVALLKHGLPCGPCTGAAQTAMAFLVRTLPRAARPAAAAAAPLALRQSAALATLAAKEEMAKQVTMQKREPTTASTPGAVKFTFPVRSLARPDVGV